MADKTPVHEARTKLSNSKTFPIIMFAIHAVVFVLYFLALFVFLRKEDAAFENGLLQFYFGGVYLGLMLASALSSSFLVAKIEVAFGVFAILFSLIGTIRDFNTFRSAFVAGLNVVWTVGLVVSLIATVIHYIELRQYRSLLRQVYGTANAEQIVYGKVQADVSASRRDNADSMNDLFQRATEEEDADDFIGQNLVNDAFTVIRTGRTFY